ncbi:hypothetical protein J41TS12_44800 [Paenibacillus antibioticophila]|uniref:Uncharacterized protein n=1 Tax=Paenibacillus antibioticophila TaxID=1274374 RepID=A0A919XV75_9BACL|nr:hypothetical protein J41TS12_44800 [Paenibacillus antibioticophila]
MEATEKVRLIRKRCSPSSQKLIAFIETASGIAQVPKVLEPLNLLKETVADDVEQHFKTKSKERYKFEAKNSELKHGHG